MEPRSNFGTAANFVPGLGSKVWGLGVKGQGLGSLVSFWALGLGIKGFVRICRLFKDCSELCTWFRV